MATNLVESRERRVKRGHPDNETYSFAKPHIVEAILNHVSGHKGGWPAIIFMRRTDQWKTINAGGVVRLLDIPSRHHIA